MSNEVGDVGLCGDIPRSTNEDGVQPFLTQQIIYTRQIAYENPIPAEWGIIRLHPVSSNGQRLVICAKSLSLEIGATTPVQRHLAP